MKKWVIASVALVLIFFLIIRGIPFLINLYLNANAERIVSNMITRTSGFAEHQVRFGEIKLDYDYSGTYLQINDIQISPLDTSERLDLSVNLSLKKANITGFRWMSFLFENSISIDSAILSELNIISKSPPLDSMEVKGSDTSSKGEKDYESIKVKHFELNKLILENRDSYTDSIRLQIMELTVHAEGFDLTKAHIQSPESLFKIDHIEGSIKKIGVHFDEYRQYAEVRNLNFDTEQNKMEVENFSLLHKLDRYAYTALFKRRKSWIEIRDSHLEVRGMNFKDYFLKGSVEIDTLIADGLQMTVFVDKRKEEDLEKRPPMIHEMLNRLSQVIHIQNTDIKNGYIKIEERANNTALKSGYVFFSEMDAQISNISNNPEKLAINSHMQMDAKAKLMGIGPMDVHLDYFLSSEDGRFKISGTLGKISVKELNTMVETEAKISIKSGVVNRLDFNILGNDHDGSGEVIVRYDNLEIELLDKNFQNEQNIFRKAGAFIANRLVIKSYNPTNKGVLKKGTVYFLREPSKPIFNYWWNLIFSGLKSTISGENLDELKKKETEKNTVSARDLRREERKQKRLAKEAN